jgi:predicted DNA-binding protein
MPTTEMDSQIAVRLPRALLEAVEELARLADRTIAAEIRRALRLHVEHEAR